MKLIRRRKSKNVPQKALDGVRLALKGLVLQRLARRAFKGYKLARKLPIVVFGGVVAAIVARRLRHRGEEPAPFEPPAAAPEPSVPPAEPTPPASAQPSAAAAGQAQPSPGEPTQPESAEPAQPAQSAEPAQPAEPAAPASSGTGETGPPTTPADGTEETPGRSEGSQG